MSRSPEKRLADIRKGCEKILRYTAGMSQIDLEHDDLVTDAVLRNIQIIGEATKNLSEEIRARMPEIEWKKIAGMRDWLSHVYFQVDPDIVWNVVEVKIPELLRAIERLEDRKDPPEQEGSTASP